MEHQETVVKSLNAFLLKKGLINGENFGFTYRNKNNPSEVLFQSFSSILSEVSGEDTVSIQKFPTDQLDVLAARLHKHHKCVIFVCDKHILKAGEIRGCIDFVGYKFLSKANESIKVYDDIEVAEDGASESLMEFIVRRRGLYMCGDDPTKLLKRTLALHLAIEAKGSEMMDIRAPRR